MPAKPVWNVLRADGSLEHVPALVTQISPDGAIMFGGVKDGPMGPQFDCELIIASGHWAEARKSSLVQ